MDPPRSPLPLPPARIEHLCFGRSTSHTSCCSSPPSSSELRGSEFGRGKGRARWVGAFYVRLCARVSRASHRLVAPCRGGDGDPTPGDPMQLGFVLDQTRCIGCHSCTVACKQENQVPVGVFRTWVKYVETGTFPDVERHFAVLRCNQCTRPPCVTICPTGALHKRPDGIVDLDREACVGCKACLQACPFETLHFDDGRRVVSKCHLCAHRLERRALPELPGAPGGPTSTSPC